MLLEGRVAVVTGAGRGIGREFARCLAREGAAVVVNDIGVSLKGDPTGEDPASAVCAEIEAAGGHAVPVHESVTDFSAAERIIDTAVETFGRIDILVNNAGIVHGGALLDVPLAKHRATVDVNLNGLLNVTHTFLPDLIARQEGHVINIASAASILALPHATSYAASKWAVLGFSDSLREELCLLGHRHIRVTTICPSYIATGLFEGAKPARLTWMLNPEDVAATVLRAVMRNRETIMLPWPVQFMYVALRGLPRRWYYQICAWLGATRSMAGWTGHSDRK
jgi:all-trans-retinol dehydrogenase (NAD+)